VIFADCAQLSARRELISLTFEEVERRLHLRAVFKALGKAHSINAFASANARDACKLCGFP
jgi:hypothetical protein